MIEQFRQGIKPRVHIDLLKGAQGALMVFLLKSNVHQRKNVETLPVHSILDTTIAVA